MKKIICDMCQSEDAITVLDFTDIHIDLCPDCFQELVFELDGVECKKSQYQSLVKYGIGGR